ncbi:MAG TPA: CPBP family intramembrane metalloprotease [Pyrinomonadaceae bacterium]|nr:CPBP family intramembrane metalloprotease [Acidobacteriota bacterium]HQZ96789.1 CPBP family intramembrane metalloprotease [Pyrinomonadaceae bacterium]
MLDIVRQIKTDFTALDRRAVFAFVYAAIGLTCITYLKSPEYLNAVLSKTRFAAIGEEAVNSANNNLYALIWWVFVSVSFYFVIPALFVKFVQKRNLSEIGLALKAERGFLNLLAICISVMLPIVYAMSLTGSFSAKYPFLKVYNGDPYWSSTLLIWEMVYFLQFFGLEFFFRGFLVHSLKPSLGIYSIFIMTVPYTMIHFQKPMPETFAAIIAGLFLGWVSYKNGTIWLGLVLHCSVAFSMDILALYHKGLLF